MTDSILQVRQLRHRGSRTPKVTTAGSRAAGLALGSLAPGSHAYLLRRQEEAWSRGIRAQASSSYQLLTH